jgi:acyl-CoA thioesterase I
VPRITLRFTWLFGVLAGLSILATLSAQTPPAASAQAPPAASAQNPAAQPAKDDYWTKHDQQLLTDFGWLEKFRQADAQLPPPAPSENRVVFMGDSITEGWHLDDSFPGKPYVNRGISGQTSPQMLVRFRQDVIDLKPKVVVILAGTNDIAGNTGPMTPEDTENNLESMADLATANGIKVVLCSVLPAIDFGWHKGLQPAEKIVAVNRWVKAYAAAKGYVWVDYHTAMKDEHDGLPVTLSHDGVHPTPAGYAVMAPLVEAGIAKALGGGS